MKEGSALSVTAGERREMREILGGANFTKRKYKQFVLLRIDAAMRGGDNPLPLPNGTIEHIYPARPAESSRWRTDFRGSEAAVLRQTIGNVTLLTIAMTRPTSAWGVHSWAATLKPDSACTQKAPDTTRMKSVAQRPGSAATAMQPTP